MNDKPTDELRLVKRGNGIVSIQRKWRVGRKVPQENWYDDAIEYRDVWRDLPVVQAKKVKKAK